MLIILTFLLSSCAEEDYSVQDENPKKIESIDFNQIKVEDGRLFFPNQSTFQSYYKELGDKNENEIAEILDQNFYANGFYSLKPIVNDITEGVQVERHLNKFESNFNNFNLKTSTADDSLLDNLDDLEDVFGEEVFNSLLNQEGELQVGKKVYKYTDAGLFITDKNKVSELNTFLDSKEISRNLMMPTEESNRMRFIEENGLCGETNQLDEFEYFIPEADDCDGDNWNPPTNNSTNNSNNVSYNAENINEIIKTLEECSGKKPILGNVFGSTTRVCIDKYESKRRVKIKYYNIDLKLIYAIGVKVKHQYKGWTGIWRKQDTDKLATGVDSLSWAFDLSHMVPNKRPSTLARFQTSDGKSYESVNGYYNSVYIGQNKPVPPLPFAHKLDVIVEVITDGYTPLENEYEVRKFFYDKLFDTAKGLLNSYQKKQLKKAGVVIHANQYTWVQYYDFEHICTDCDKIEEVFDWGAFTPKIIYTFDNPGGFEWNNFKLEVEMDFKRPKLTGMNMYGMAQRNGKWHGKKMVF